ncbi:AAA family ATPase [Paracoccus sp. SCSIO 75233]|uniref:AAA family ATPase n=1 Tax=Paracoccus sp. SCSIO 75233 TaxID=3017782 RepID=UPI0022F0ADD4|nr:AAA family ATPase [Paracoccus sp. SCSIO 75233]WBU54759.1 AAA family ATPase [Paracoccus sp. SCSIO 75233]
MLKSRASGGEKNVSLKFREDLNFLIGPNGSGKTTIINLISAVLRADIPALYSVQFEKVVIRLKTIGANRKPVIEVAKVVDRKMGSFELRYTVKEKSGDKGQSYGVEGPHDERIYKDYKYTRFSRYMEEGARLSKILSNLVEVNWLSINRSSSAIDRRNRRDEGYESSVDQKLHDISQAFSQYFSLLTSKAEAESKNFQEHVFLSLLDQNQRGEDVLNQVVAEPEDKVTVVGVLRDLGVSNQKATKSVNTHFSRLDEAKKRFQEDRAFTLEDAITLSDARRVSEMIDEWRDLQSKRQSIFEPRIQFERIINTLLSGKELHFDARNNPKVHLESGDIVDIDVFSSGEKQLFILLGEALLQEERAVIFISDEPELSLHVSWQSSLFENIRSLNGSCQIISATHSPDIVGAFQDRVIRIEQCMSDVH